MELEHYSFTGHATGPALLSINRTNNNDCVRAGSKFLARGAAADVWSAQAPDVNGRKPVLKTGRISLEILRENCNPKGSKRAEHMWEEFINAFRSKAEQWKALQHDNVVQLFGISEELDLCVEFCANGTASQYLDEHPQDHIKLRKRIISDVLAGVGYLHSREPAVVHGSLSMDKLLIDSQGITKIGEFGKASLVEEFGLFAPSISQTNRTRWLSPELLDADTEDQCPTTTIASDTWALGCTLFEILTGKLPYHKFKHDLRVQQEILSKKFPGRQDSFLSLEFVEFWPLLTQCWSWKPGQRPDVNSLTHFIFRDSGPQLRLQLPPDQAQPSATAVATPPLEVLTELPSTSLSKDIPEVDATRSSSTGTSNEPVAIDSFAPTSVAEHPPTSRACIGCMVSKNKCTFSSPGISQCQRCQRYRRECIFRTEQNPLKPFPIKGITEEIRHLERQIEEELASLRGSVLDISQPHDPQSVVGTSPPLPSAQLRKSQPTSGLRPPEQNMEKDDSQPRPKSAPSDSIDESPPSDKKQGATSPDKGKARAEHGVGESSEQRGGEQVVVALRSYR